MNGDPTNSVVDLIGQLAARVTDLEKWQEDNQALRDEHQSLQVDFRCLQEENQKLRKETESQNRIQLDMEDRYDELQEAYNAIQSTHRELGLS